MGSSHTTHVLRIASAPDVPDFLPGRGVAAFVSSGKKGCTVVMDAESDGLPLEYVELPEELSQEFLCPVLSLMVHGDVTVCGLWDSGEWRHLPLDAGLAAGERAA